MSSVSRQGFLGTDQDRVFATLKIGIIGLGGGGSVVVQQLAHIGFRHYLLVDFDRIEMTNLNRLIGGTRLDVLLRLSKLAIAERTIKRLQLKARIGKRPCRWQEAMEDLKQCDVIIGALDGFGQRAELENFCRRFLIPYIDIGMDVYGLGDGTSLVSGQVIASIPGEPCMRCCNFITDERLEQEARRYGDAGIRPQVVWPNGLLASAAVGELMAMVLPWFRRQRGFTYLIYDANKNQLIASPHVKALEGTACPHHPWSQVGDPLFSTERDRQPAVSMWQRLWATIRG
jgi:molybdopterin/thiamine biosynthesis adenylyltransferase